MTPEANASEEASRALELVGQLTPTSLILPEGLPFEAWKTGMQNLARVESRLQWWIGDAILFGERTYGQHAWDVVNEVELHHTRASLQNIVRVCAAIPPAVRRPGLKYSHHAIVYKFPPAQRDEWLTRAETGHWRIKHLRAAVGFAGLEEAGKREHTRIQGMLVKLGQQMRNAVWVGRDDRSRAWRGKRFTDMGILERLPPLVPGNKQAQRSVEYIDVIWLQETGGFVAAFEIEHTTSIYSGLLRMSDLLALVPNLQVPLYVVAPAGRRKAVIREVNRPTFRKLKLGDKCRLITFETLTEEVRRYGDIASHLLPSFLDRISESCELPGPTIPSADAE